MSRASSSSRCSALRERGVDLTHYIGSHPLAGRERGGAIAARADIFVGRPWVVCRDEETSASDLALVEGLALDLGATPIEMTPEDHDRAVALVSHVPQLVASLLAGRFVDAPDGSLRLAGQGVRDTTRIAASAPELWVQILGANAAPVVDVLDALAADLPAVADALRAPEAPGARRAVADTIRRGNDGVERLPGKHGQNRRFEQVVVMVDDTPGQLGRLFGELGELDVNVEDLRLEHSPGAQFGLAEISVVPGAVRRAAKGSRPAAGRLRAPMTDPRRARATPVVVAIDGPAGSGKSSVSKQVASRGGEPPASRRSTCRCRRVRRSHDDRHGHPSREGSVIGDARNLPAAGFEALRRRGGRHSARR